MSLPANNICQNGDVLKKPVFASAD